MRDDDILTHYSRALDEVYRLRTILAYEARVTEAHLGFRTFPKSRRLIAEAQVERMRAAARGRAPYLGMAKEKSALRAAGASETLTRSEWEASA